MTQHAPDAADIRALAVQLETMWANPTPGRWHANEDGLVWSDDPKLGRRNVICAVLPADARLIAAAPELLAALQEAVALLGISALPDGRSAYAAPVTVRARAALAKATGA